MPPMKPLLLLIVAAATMATTQDASRQAPAYERRELRIPMRDGTHLFAVALIPRDTSGPPLPPAGPRGLRIPMRAAPPLFPVPLIPRDTSAPPLPILLIRTPYSAA